MTPAAVDSPKARPIECAPWCANGDRHSYAQIQDHTCRGVGFVYHPTVLKAFESETQHVAELTMYARQLQDAEPHVCLNVLVGAGGVDMVMTAAAARQVATKLLIAANEIDGENAAS